MHLKLLLKEPPYQKYIKAQGGFVEIIREIVDAGCPVDIKSDREVTALIMACDQENGSSNLDAINLLISLGSDIHCMDRVGRYG